MRRPDPGGSGRRLATLTGGNGGDKATGGAGLRQPAQHRHPPLRARVVEEKTEYVPPRTYTVPRHYGGYYEATWDAVHQPGYFETHTIVRLETNLYGVGTGEPVWSGQSETFNPDSLEDIIDSATQAVAKRLGDESLITPGPVW